MVLQLNIRNVDTWPNLQKLVPKALRFLLYVVLKPNIIVIVKCLNNKIVLQILPAAEIQ